MKYIKSKDLDYFNAFYHFSRIDSRESIEKNGLQSVAGGENEAIGDKNNKTIYFTKGIGGALKAIDVWARWEYDKYVRESGLNINYGYQGYDKSVMKEVVFNKLYDDFKNRQYYVVDFIEGKDGDFEYGDIDIKKSLSRDSNGRPYRSAVWKYGEFSDWGTPENPNNTQENWNMNTKIGDRVITSDRLKIIEAENGRTDALSFAIEMYERFRSAIPEQDNPKYEILDNFMSYAIERYKTDKDYQEGMPDLGRRVVDKQEEEKWQRVNKIDTSKVVQQVVEEMSDTPYTDETEKEMESQELELQQAQKKIIQPTEENQVLGG